MVLHKVSARRDRTWDRTVQQTFCDITEVHVIPRPWPWAYPGCRPGWEPLCASLVAFQPFACEKIFSWNHKSVCIMWPWPRPRARPGCRLFWGPSSESLVAIQTFAWEKKRFSWNHKSVPITWPLNSTLTLSISWMRALLGTIVCKFGGNPAICWVEEAICAKCLQMDRRMDRQTDDGRCTIA